MSKGTCPEDSVWMGESLLLAAEAYGETSPNPLVGAVVTCAGKRLGAGVHRRVGLPHAEPQALDMARATDVSTDTSDRRWTLYINLEPCAHQARTPPCVEAILASPVARVVTALVDPDPRVAGRGIARLRAAGLKVDLGCRAREAVELNHVFFARQRRARPFVALKVALSSDGCVAAADGRRVVITGPEAQRHTHWLRAGLDAILIGVETLRRDRPRLDRRLYSGPGREPRRLVLDPDLRSEPGWLWPGEARPVVFCRERARAAHGRRYGPVADLEVLPERGAGLDLAALPEALARLELWSVLVEGGGRTHWGFLEAGLWDRLYVYRNPALELGGLPWAADAAWAAARRDLEPLERRQLGADRIEVFAHPGTLPEF